MRQQDEWITTFASQILKVYIKALTTFSYIGHVGVLNTISLSQTMSLQQPSGTGKESGTHVPKTGEGVRSLQSSGQAQCQLAAIPNSNT